MLSLHEGTLPPPPPSTLDAIMAILFASVTISLCLWLLFVSVGWLTTPNVTPSRVWLVYPITQFYFHLAARGMGPLLGAEMIYASELPSSDRVALGIFSALLAQASVFIFFCKIGPSAARVHVMHPPAAIYLLAWSYYAHKAVATVPVVPADVFGLQFYPLHLVLWMCSTAAQCVLWKQIEHIQTVGGPHTAFSLPAKPILLSALMLWCGLLGSLDYRHGLSASVATTLNVALNVASFACFYALLITSTRPLKSAADYYRRYIAQVPHGAKGSKASSLSIQAAETLQRHFRWARTYVWLSWHGFPFIWVLGACGLISAEHRELLYVCCDLAAKFLPVSIYLSLLALP